jgi:Flp pilus assembly pilin Flp
MRIWRCFRRCQDGATAIEYALIAAGISVAISVVVFTLGNSLRDLFYVGLLSALGG